MRKKVFLVIGFVLLAAILWYLLIKPYDFLATFKVKASPGTINQTIKLWASTLEDSEVIKQSELTNFEHRITLNDSAFVYNWKIEKVDDSLSRVNVSINDSKHSLMNRLSMPFLDTDFEKRSEKTILEFHEKLKEHLDNFKVSMVGIDSIPSSYCAYVSLKSTQIEKAAKMMRNYPLLDGLVANQNIKANGRPFIEITDWNMAKDSIAYNFCYPIIKSDSLPEHKIIKYKQFEGGKGLKAIYNGNYITSDRAWYSLRNEAQKLNIKITGNPVEIFHSNPNMGNNEIEWVAEIYMPLISMKKE
ncbi:MAG: GyrI-like domain-containing protein [Aurantibacter sp.]